MKVWVKVVSLEALQQGCEDPQSVKDGSGKDNAALVSYTSIALLRDLDKSLILSTE